jgi:hypothetical protein
MTVKVTITHYDHCMQGLTIYWEQVKPSDKSYCVWTWLCWSSSDTLWHDWTYLQLIPFLLSFVVSIWSLSGSVICQFISIWEYTICATNSTMQVMQQEWILWSGNFMQCMTEKEIPHCYCLMVNFGFNSMNMWNIKQHFSIVNSWSVYYLMFDVKRLVCGM